MAALIAVPAAASARLFTCAVTVLVVLRVPILVVSVAFQTVVVAALVLRAGTTRRAALDPP